MTVTSSNRSQTLACDGLTTSWPLTFGFDHPKDLVATLVVDGLSTPLAWPADFDASATLQQSGTFTTTTVYPAGALIHVERKTRALQERTVSSKARLDLAALERALDRLTFYDQDWQAAIGTPSARVLRMPDFETGTLNPLPAAGGRAGRLLGFNGAGQPIVVDPETLGGDGGGGGDPAPAGSLHGLLADRTTDETDALTVAIQAAIDAGEPGITFEGPAGRGIHYAGFVRIMNPTERPFKVSFKGVDLLPGPNAEIRGDGRIRELPGSGLFKLWQDVDATGGPVTTFDIDAGPQGGDVSVLRPGAPFVLRGENGADGIVLDTHYHEDAIVAVTPTGTANRFTIELENGLPSSVPGGVWRRTWPDSAHPKIGEPGFTDDTLISVVDEVELEADLEDSAEVPLPAEVPLSRFAVGSWVLAQDDTIAADFVGVSQERLMRQMARVAAHDAGAHALILDRAIRGKLRVELDGSPKRARVTGLVPCFDLEIEGPRAIEPTAAPGSARRHIVNFRHCVRAKSHGFRLDGRETTHDVRGALIREHLSADGRHWGSERWYPHHVDVGGDSNGVWLKGCSGTVVERMLMVGCRHGITPGSGVGIEITRNTVVDSWQSAIDCGHGENGQGVKVLDNLVVAGPALPDRPVQKGIEVSNGYHLFGDRDALIERNRLVGFHGPNAVAILLRAGARSVKVRDNETDTPATIGVKIEANKRAPDWPISNIEIEGSFAGTAQPVVIDGRAPAWVVDEEFAGTAERPVHVENGGRLYRTAEVKLGGAAPVHTSGTVDGWEHVGAPYRPVSKIDMTQLRIERAAVPFRVHRCDKPAVRDVTIRDVAGSAVLDDSPTAIIGPAVVDGVGDGSLPWLAIGDSAGAIVVHPRVTGAQPHSGTALLVPLAGTGGDGGGEEQSGGALTIADYGGDATGVEYCDTAFQAMLAELGYVAFGPGLFRFAAVQSVPPGSRVFGIGVDITVIDAEGALWLDLQRNADGTAGTLDWCRSHVSHLSVRMDRGGIKGFGHEIRIHDVNFYGGKGRANTAEGADPQHWCIDLRASNECYIANISGGYGGGPFELYANGIRFWAADVADERNVNYGDSLLQEISLKGSDVIDWIGIQLMSESTHPVFGAFNNMVLSRTQFQAPSPGGIIIDPGDGVTPLTVPTGSTHSWKGSIAYRFHNVRKCSFICLNGESAETFVRITGYKGGVSNDLVDGVPVPSDPPVGYGQGRTSRDNVWIGCQALNNGVNWSDSNGTGQDLIHPAYTDGTVGWNTVSGGFGIAPRLPNPANGSYDSGLAANEDAPASVNDSFLPPGNLWWSRPGSSNPALAMRLTDDEALYISSLKQETDRPWSTTVKYRSPHSTLGIRVGHAQREGHIFMPQGMGMDPPREARIKIGNGPDFELSGGLAIGPLQRVEIADPLWLTPLSESPGLGGGLPHAMIHAAVPAALGVATPETSPVWWTGPGLYASIDDREDGGASYVGGWAPLTIRPGFTVAQLNRTGETYTLSRNDAGKLATYNRATLQTVTIPAGLVRDDESLGNVHRGALRFRLRAEGDGGLRFVAGTGVTLYGAAVIGGEVTAREKGSIVQLDYVRTGVGTAAVYVDVIGNPSRTRKVVAIGTSGVGNPSADNYTYTVQRGDLGGVLAATFASPGTVELRFDGAVLVPVSGPEVGELYVRNASTGTVDIAVTAGTTAAAGALLTVEPGETVLYVIERTSATTWLLSNVTQSTPSATPGTPAASAVTFDDTGLPIAAADAQTAIGALAADVDALAADVEGSDDILVVAAPVDDEIDQTFASGRITRRMVLFENAEPVTVTFNDDAFPSAAGAAREYNLLFEGDEVSLDLGASDEVITPSAAVDIDAVSYDGTGDPMVEVMDFTLGGAGFRPVGMGQVAILSVVVTHRQEAAVPIDVVWPAGVVAIAVAGNGDHVPDPAGASPEYAGVWNSAPTHRSWMAILGETDTVEDFSVQVTSAGQVYAASASLVILNDWRRMPAYAGGEAMFLSQLEGDATVTINGAAEPTGFENGIRVSHYHGLNLAAAPADPPIVWDDGGGGSSETPIADAFASSDHATDWWHRLAAAVVVSFERDDIIGDVTDGGGTGAAAGEMREAYVHTTLRQQPEPLIAYRGPGVFPAQHNPRALKLIARPGKKLTAVNV